ncbi:MAG: hypothetical protein KKA41_05015 [Proteobacteria bacterium]|nr:hypothetical protein [Pseudomonadota bacterium]
MLKKTLMLAIAVGLTYISGAATGLYADQGEEIVGHPMPKYSRAVQAVETDDTLLLTQDRIDKVKKFFEQNGKDGDRIEVLPEEDRQAYQMRFYAKIHGTERSVPLVKFEEKTPDNNMHPALGELKGLFLMGKHSEVEYQGLENQYKNLHLAYFRQVSDDQGGTVAEGEKIYRKAYDQAHGKANTTAFAPDPNQKARAQDMKKQMQEMKAKGDIAGMMNMAQQFNKAPGQTQPGAAAMDEMNKDTWDLWVKCLEDIAKVAYWTRIEYAASPR